MATTSDGIATRAHAAPAPARAGAGEIVVRSQRLLSGGSFLTTAYAGDDADPEHQRDDARCGAERLHEHESACRGRSRDALARHEPCDDLRADQVRQPRAPPPSENPGGRTVAVLAFHGGSGDVMDDLERKPQGHDRHDPRAPDPTTAMSVWVCRGQGFGVDPSSPQPQARDDVAEQGQDGCQHCGVQVGGGVVASEVGGARALGSDVVARRRVAQRAFEELAGGEETRGDDRARGSTGTGPIDGPSGHGRHPGRGARCWAGRCRHGNHTWALHVPRSSAAHHPARRRGHPRPVVYSAPCPSLTLVRSNVLGDADVAERRIGEQRAGLGVGGAAGSISRTRSAAQVGHRGIGEPDMSSLLGRDRGWSPIF